MQYTHLAPKWVIIPYFGYGEPGFQAHDVPGYTVDYMDYEIMQQKEKIKQRIAKLKKSEKEYQKKQN